MHHIRRMRKPRVLGPVVAALVVASSMILATLGGGVANAASGTWKNITNSQTFNRPLGIAVNSAGDLFVTNGNDMSGSTAVEEGVPVTTSSGTTYTWKGIVPSGVTITKPSGIAVDSAGNLFVTADNTTIWEGSPSGSTYTWTNIAPKYSGGNFYALSAIAVDSAGDLFVTNSGTGSSPVQELPAGQTTWINLTGGGSFSWPDGIAVDSAGALFVTSQGNNTIEEGTPSGTTYTWTTIQNGDYGLVLNSPPRGPTGVAVDSAGDLFVTNWTNYGSCVVQELPSPIGSTTAVDLTNKGNFSNTYGIAVDSAGDLFVTNAAWNGTNAVEEDPTAIPAITTTSLPEATLNTPYSQTLQAIGGTGSLSWSALGLPTGLTLNATTGVLSGTPSTAGTTTVRVTVTDAIGGTASHIFTLSAANIGSIALTTNSTDVLTDSTVTVNGGVYNVYGVPVPYAVVDMSGSGGTLSSQAVTADVYGQFKDIWTAPTVTTETSATVTATVYGTVYGSVANNVTPTTLSFEVSTLPSVSTTTLSGGTVGSAYSQTLNAVNGFAPYQWSVTSGSLPAGLTLTSTGVISGIPMTAGTSSFTVQVKDAGGYTATQSLSITVAASNANEGSSNHHSGGSGSGGSGGSTISTTGTSAGTTTGTNTNTNTAPELPTVVVSHTFSSTGGTIQKSQRNLTVNINVPQGAFTEPETMTVTTKLVNGLSHSSIAVVLGVNFSGANPTKPVTVTITDPSLPADAVLYKLTSDGNLVPMKASVSAGKAVVSFTSDPDFVVLNVKKDERVITMAGQARIVPGLVQADPVSKNKTTYMPIWYVMQMLKTLNISSTWNGHDWRLTTANEPTLGKLNPGKGSMHLYLNGTLVQNVTGVYAKDPSTEKNTTYMPIWYVMQLLNKLSISSSWNGTTWTLTNNAAQNGRTSSTN